MSYLEKIKSIKQVTQYHLIVDDVKVVYHNIIRVLSGVSLKIKQGDIVALLGNNGSGKTTVLRAISGQLKYFNGKPTDGRVIFNNIDLWKENLKAHDIVGQGLSLIPEGRHIFKHMTVEENIKVGALIRLGSAGFNLHEELKKMYDYFEPLKKLKHQNAGYLSGGEQQMVAIARGLISRPSLLMLDEPSLGLAPILTKNVFEIIRAINRDLKTTVLLVEQNAKAALDLANYGYILDLGRIALSGSSEELKNNKDVQDFYLGVGKNGQRRTSQDFKSYRRRRRWE